MDRVDARRVGNRDRTGRGVEAEEKRPRGGRQRRGRQVPRGTGKKGPK